MYHQLNRIRKSYPCGMFSLFLLLSAKPSGAGRVSNSSGCESLLKSGIGLKDATLGVGLGQGDISTLLQDSRVGIKLILSDVWSVCNKPGISKCCFLSKLSILRTQVKERMHKSLSSS